jgi:hypothetical protein
MMLLFNAVFLILAAVLRRSIIEPINLSAIESFSAMEYQLDDSRFLATPNAILDAIDYAKKCGYETVDLLSFSLGSLLSTDAIYPRKKRKQTWSPQLEIENWITIGYPYDLTSWSRPDYFSDRQSAAIDYRHWINVVVQLDFLGTTFSKGDGRGISVKGDANLYAPDVKREFKPTNMKSRNCKDWFIPMRRTFNHRIYWDDENARASTCFDQIVDESEAGWTREILAVLNKT